MVIEERVTTLMVWGTVSNTVLVHRRKCSDRPANPCGGRVLDHVEGSVIGEERARRRSYRDRARPTNEGGAGMNVGNRVGGLVCRRSRVDGNGHPRTRTGADRIRRGSAGTVSAVVQTWKSLTLPATGLMTLTSVRVTVPWAEMPWLSGTVHHRRTASPLRARSASPGWHRRPGCRSRERSRSPVQK